MVKRFHFDSPPEVYRADAAVVWCFDDRFTLAVQKFLKRTGIARADSIRVAGGAKSLASPNNESERTFVLEQLRLSRQLHGTARVMLIAHRDCGTYGGLARFNGDANAETQYHLAELERAVSAIRTAFPEITVACFFADFDGVWEMPVSQSTGAD